jgi:ABC-type oligopeptide transport system substrate-binding subunit
VRHSFERLLLNEENAGSRFSYSCIRGAKALLNGEGRDLTGFKIHSAEEFSIELEEPLAIFPALISYHAAAVVPEGSEKFGNSWQDGSVGTGPFRVVKFEPGVRLELERNKSYWRTGYPKCEGLTFNFGVSPTEILSQFRAGRFANLILPPATMKYRGSRLITSRSTFIVGHCKTNNCGRRWSRHSTWAMSFGKHLGVLRCLPRG